MGRRGRRRAVGGGEPASTTDYTDAEGNVLTVRDSLSAGTALSPCVLPVLPIALSAGATGGARRPLGIVTGLALSFTFVTVALVYVIHALGLPDDLLRTVAIVGLILFGLALAIPPIGDRLEAWLQRIAPARSRRHQGEGF